MNRKRGALFVAASNASFMELGQYSISERQHLWFKTCESASKWVIWYFVISCKIMLIKEIQCNQHNRSTYLQKAVNATTFSRKRSLSVEILFKCQPMLTVYDIHLPPLNLLETLVPIIPNIIRFQITPTKLIFRLIGIYIYYFSAIPQIVRLPCSAFLIS